MRRNSSSAHRQNGFFSTFIQGSSQTRHRFILSWYMHRTDAIRQRETSSPQHTHLAGGRGRPRLRRRRHAKPSPLPRRGALRLPRRARASSACGAQGFPAAESAERGVSLAPCVGCVGSGQVWRCRGGYPARAARRAIPGESAPRDPRPQATRAARPGPDLYQMPGPYNCMDGYFRIIFKLQYERVYSLVSIYIFDTI